jgi:hypothetical protein
MGVTRSYKFIGFGDIHGPKPYKFIGFGDSLHRACTLEGYNLFEDLKSAILGVWAAPGARDTIPKGGGRSPPPFGRASGAPGATQTPKVADFRSFKKLKNYLPQYSHVIACPCRRVDPTGTPSKRCPATRLPRPCRSPGARPQRTANRVGDLWMWSQPIKTY